MKVILAEPRGFCAGVERAVEIVERALEVFGPPVYVRHEIVHNKRVVDNLKEKGAVFVEELDEVPDGGVTIFSAHGVSEKVENTAEKRGLPVIDATCPLVAKVHIEAIRYENEGKEVVLIGHEGHPEVEGTSGRVKKGVHIVATPDDVAHLKVSNPDQVAYVTQTTLSVDDTREVIEALKNRYPNISGPDVKDICYATQNRQASVRLLAEEVDMILVVGAKNSSNSNRLRDLGEEMGVPTHLINDARDVNPNWFEKIKKIGITAGASAPELLVQEVVSRIRELGNVELCIQDGIKERVRFKLPTELVKQGEDGKTPIPENGKNITDSSFNFS
ncbi:MAG: 4-hydroxy-3-methylbut-2-enyl diphosphate reductase [Rhodospirillaceae bacterium]|nr:4-hydroxy-3-methylbut-2-enyl diphosphate reductase [Rhodospirillaceae bacterium]|tara:strand:- start:102 stop:1097 length:996 start_codon:yes stop_codon:yes gene_type:complete